ncbi:hypothetical protein D9M68_310490 [compost metagenome]
MHDTYLYATLPAADDQPAITTTHLAAYQDAVDGAAVAVTAWLQAPAEHSLLEVLHGWLERLPGSTQEPFRDAFILRLQQRLRACHEGAAEPNASPEQAQTEGYRDA